MLATSASWRCWLALGGGGLQCNDVMLTYIWHTTFAALTSTDVTQVEKNTWRKRNSPKAEVTDRNGSLMGVIQYEAGQLDPKLQ